MFLLRFITKYGLCEVAFWLAIFASYAGFTYMIYQGYTKDIPMIFVPNNNA